MMGRDTEQASPPLLFEGYVHRFDQPGYYIGQVLSEKLVLAEFSVLVDPQAPDADRHMDVETLCKANYTHFRLSPATALLLHAPSWGNQLGVQLARREKDGFCLICASPLASAQTA